MRFFRFFASYGSGEIDPIGLSACIAERSGIEGLSGERIQAETLRLLVAPRAVQALRVMDENDILQLALGTRPKVNVFERLVSIEESLALQPDDLLRLAALTIEQEQDVLAITSKLKLSNAQARRLSFTTPLDVDELDFTIPISKLDERSLRQMLYRLGTRAYLDRCLLTWARSCDGDGDGDGELVWKKAYELPQRWSAPSLPFSGADLIARGFKAGPSIGKVLSQFETWWVLEDFPQDRQLLETKLLELANCA